jgi:hypothetical protein
MSAEIEHESHTRLKTHRLFQVDIIGVNNVVRPTMNKLSTMLFQVVTVEQCCNNMLTILFIVGRTTLFTPVDINLEQVVDFLNIYACINYITLTTINCRTISTLCYHNYVLFNGFKHDFKFNRYIVLPY